MCIFVVGMIYIHILTLIRTVTRVLDIHTLPTQVCIQDSVPSLLVKKLCRIKPFRACHNKLFLALTLPYDHFKANGKSCFLLKKGDGLLIKIHSGSIFFIFSMPQLVLMLVIKWLSNLDSFSFHHPTKPGAASKQFKLITLLIVVKPKCLFTKTSFSQEVMIFSLHIIFILFSSFFSSIFWTWHTMPCHSS